MRLIVITPPDSIPAEPLLATRILRQGKVALHLRKPGLGPAAVADYLRQIPVRLHRRIVLHGHPELMARFDLGGIHFTEKARLLHPGQIHRLRRQRPDACLSTAFHRIADIPDPDGSFDYIFLSPIFDSISKTGYRAAFDTDALRRFLKQTMHAVIALGGIDAQRLTVAASLGFKGAAVLGAVWQTSDPPAAAARLMAVCRGLTPPPVRGAPHKRE